MGSPLREFVRIFFRHKGKIGLAFVAIVGAVALFTLLSPPSYRSQAKLFVRLGRENATLDPTATVGQAPVVAVPQSRENEVSTAVEILKSRVLVEKVVDALGPATILNGAPATEDAAGSDHEAALERYRAIITLARRLDVEPVKKSNVVVVSCEGQTPELAQTVVSRLVDFYLDRHIQLSRSPKAQQFLTEQTARQRAQLTRVEDELRNLKNDTGLIAPEWQRQLVATRIGRLEDDLLQTKSALAAAEAEVQRLKEKLAGLPPTQVLGRAKVRNEAADNLRGQLFSLQMLELELRLKYAERHPDVQRARQQVAAAKDLLRQEEVREQITEGPSRIHEETQLAVLRQGPLLASLRAKADTLRAQLGEQRGYLKALNENSLRLARLERDFALQEASYRRYAENLEQAQIDSALEAGRMSNISIVQPATHDLKPVRPRLLLNFGLGLVLAVCASLGLAFVAERLDPSVKTPEDVEQRLGLAVLASVPRLSHGLLNGREEKR